MAVSIDVQNVLTVAEISQYLSQRDIAKNINTGTGDVNVGYSRLLYMVRQAVQFAFSQNPDDDTLNATARYLYSLCGRYISSAQTIAESDACSAPVIIIQPESQAAEEGDSVTFSVIGYSLADITYQWYKDGVAISGETDSFLELATIDSGDFADYTVKLTTPCGTVTSSAAVLSGGAAEAPLTYFGTNEDGDMPTESEILAGDSAEEDPLSDVELNWGSVSPDPVYYWLAIPDTGSAAEKNYWYESVLNQGDMGGEGNLFGDPTTVSVDGQDYFVWITNYLTQFTTNDYVFSKE